MTACVSGMGKQCTHPEVLNKFENYKFISISKRREAKCTRGLSVKKISSRYFNEEPDWREGKRMQTIDTVLSTRNLTEACSGVVKNKGAGGIDGMCVKKLKSYLDKHREELCSCIREGMYIPQPIRGKETSKRKGKKRLLGILTVVGWML